MTYVLRDTDMRDVNFILNLRQDTIKTYIKEIWGWNEEFQRNDFIESFQPNLNKIITYKGIDIGVLELNENEFEINITEIEILPAYQGIGIGSTILKDILANASELNKKVAIGTFKANFNAIRLYDHLGFNKVNETETHVLMSKPSE